MYGRGQQNNNICKFYQQGRCKFGDNCKFSHGDDGGQQANNNPFAALNNQGNQRNARPVPARADQYRPGHTEQSQPAPFLVTREGIETDLKSERPQWPFSAYGPGRDAPKQLFEGALEQSFEEMRVAFYLAQAQGNVQLAIQNEQELLQKSTAQVQQVLSNLDGAVQYVISGRNEPNNRLERVRNPLGTTQQGSAPAPAATSSAFGQPSNIGNNAAPSAFGRPAVPAFGAASQPGGFAKPAAPAFGAASQPGGFGQPSAPAPTGAFGQTSALGQGSAFGKPAFGQAAFGQPSAPGQAGGFGQASASGQTGGFGQPSAPGQTSTFGQASAFGRSAFGQASNPGPKASPFGQAVGIGASQPSPFASAVSNQQNSTSTTSPFGQAVNPTNQSSTFGQASPFGAAKQPSAFGQPTTAPSSAFGQPTIAPSSAFGQPTAPLQSSGWGQGSGPSSTSTFGQPTGQSQSNPFAKPAEPVQSSQPNPFNQQNSTTNPSPFAQQLTQTLPAPSFGQAETSTQVNGTANNTLGGPLTSPDPSTYITRNPNDTLRSWKNSQVKYVGGVPRARRNDGTFQMIFHPDGPPEIVPGLEDRPEAYNATLEAAYAFVRETGTFRDGIMPDVPPKREWVRFDV